MAFDTIRLDRLKAGDEGAFTTLVEEYQPRLTGYLLHLVGDFETAKDLTQETFLRAFRAFPKMDGSLNLSSWLFTIATNCALDTLRRRKLIGWLPLSEHQRVRVVSSDETSSEGELVRQTLLKLKATERSALLLYFHYGFSCRESGTILGISENAFIQRLHRARLAFKQVYVYLEQRGQAE